MVDGADSAGPVDRLQNLLLDMTGRIDDDAVNTARELLGAGQPGAAAELLVGCLLAGGIPVTPSQQYHLRWVLEQCRSRRTLVDRLQVLDGIPSDPHRFGEPDLSEGEIAAALRPVARRLTGLRALWCVSRTTPAGVTYGAVPQHVLIAEVVSDSAVPAAGYQMLEALRSAGINCSVDVFSSGTDLPDYHRNALSAARKVDVGAAAVGAQPANHARAPRRSSGGEPAGASASDAVGEPPAGVPPAPVERVAEASPGATQRGPPRAGSVEAGGIDARGIDAGGVDAGPSGVEPSTGPLPEPPSAEPPRAAPPRAEAEPREQAGQGANNPRVPAAVDAKLTDRERNLLRKLHEELAQREQDKPVGRGESEATEQVSLSRLGSPANGASANGASANVTEAAGPGPNGTGPNGTGPNGMGAEASPGSGGVPGNQYDSRWATMPGTGGFPPIGSSAAGTPRRPHAP